MAACVTWFSATSHPGSATRNIQLVPIGQTGSFQHRAVVLCSRLMSDVLPSSMGPMSCNKILPPAPTLHTTSRPLASNCSNHSFTHAASDPLPLKRLRTTSSSLTPPRTCPAGAAVGPPLASGGRARVPSNATVPAAATCASPQSDACAPSQGSQQKNRGHFAAQRQREEVAHTHGVVNEVRGGALPEDMLDATSTLPRLLAQYGARPPLRPVLMYRLVSFTRCASLPIPRHCDDPCSCSGQGLMPGLVQACHFLLSPRYSDDQRVITEAAVYA